MQIPLTNGMMDNMEHKILKELLEHGQRRTPFRDVKERLNNVLGFKGFPYVEDIFSKGMTNVSHTLIKKCWLTKESS